MKHAAPAARLSRPGACDAHIIFSPAGSLYGERMRARAVARGAPGACTPAPSAAKLTALPPRQTRIRRPLGIANHSWQGSVYRCGSSRDSLRQESSVALWMGNCQSVARKAAGLAHRVEPVHAIDAGTALPRCCAVKPTPRAPCQRGTTAAARAKRPPPLALPAPAASTQWQCSAPPPAPARGASRWHLTQPFPLSTPRRSQPGQVSLPARAHPSRAAPPRRGRRRPCPPPPAAAPPPPPSPSKGTSQSSGALSRLPAASLSPLSSALHAPPRAHPPPAAATPGATRSSPSPSPGRRSPRPATGSLTWRCAIHRPPS